MVHFGSIVKDNMVLRIVVRFVDYIHQRCIYRLILTSEK
jgi:hypothetical protein